MAISASIVYNEAASQIAAGTLIWSGVGADTIKAALITTAATPDKDHTAVSSYTATRVGIDQTLASKSVVKNTTDDRVEFQQSVALTWTLVAAGSTVGGILIYKFVTDDAGSTPICLVKTNDLATNGGDVVWTPTGNVVFYVQQ